MGTLTFRFRAKRDTYTDSRSENYSEWVERAGYRIPAVTATHVVTPRHEWGTAHTLTFGPARGEFAVQRVRNALMNAGLCDRYVFEGDEGVTVRPIGNGYMADVEVTIPFTVAATRGRFGRSERR